MRKAILGAIVAALIAAGGVYVRAQGGPAASLVPGTTAHEAIDAAAAALGGADGCGAPQHHADRVRAIRVSERRRQHFTVARARRRNSSRPTTTGGSSDLQNMRMLHQERRNDLFPFANYGGHNFALARQGLDGAEAYNVNAQGAVQRGGDARDRRMWFYTNPVTAVRAVLTGAATVANRRQQDGLTLVDLTLKEGDRITLAIRAPENRPHWISWVGPNTNLGEVVYTTTFYGYRAVRRRGAADGLHDEVRLARRRSSRSCTWTAISWMRESRTWPHPRRSRLHRSAARSAGPPQLGAGTLTQSPISRPASRSVAPRAGTWRWRRPRGAARGGGGASSRSRSSTSPWRLALWRRHHRDRVRRSHHAVRGWRRPRAGQAGRRAGAPARAGQTASHS